jgi:hypothetical protein
MASGYELATNHKCVTLEGKVPHVAIFTGNALRQLVF